MTEAQLSRWNTENIRAMTAIILNFASDPMAKMSKFIDEGEKRTGNI